jgi:hypothetical protein
MKIRSVRHNNRKKAFEVRVPGRTFTFPYSKSAPQPTVDDPVRRVFIDEELGREGFTYILSSGQSGTVHVEQVREDNQKRVAASPLSKREIVRRLGTSATQLYRLLDQTNYRKSVDQLLSLLQVVDCDVDLKVRAKTA